MERMMFDKKSAERLFSKYKLNETRTNDETIERTAKAFTHEEYTVANGPKGRNRLNSGILRNQFLLLLDPLNGENLNDGAFTGVTQLRRNQYVLVHQNLENDLWEIYQGDTPKNPHKIADNRSLQSFFDEFLKSSQTPSALETPPPSPPDLFAEFSAQTPSQVIFYGVPGAGKSHLIDAKLKGCDKGQILRTVFHPEYTNADFVGQIRPEVDEAGNARYKFHPGPFPRILERASKNPGERFYLLIEEINRGNAAAIFGDVFQLFDRDDSGESRYPIWNEDVARAAFGDASRAIRLPANLSVIATMNSSDQNVFTLDNAFLRRFDLVMVPNEIPKSGGTGAYEFRSEEIQKQAEAKIEGTSVRWMDFWERVNEKLLLSNRGTSGSEDKRLGLWFVKNKDGQIPRKSFSNKVLKYLWDDAFKFHRWELFRDGIRSLESLIRNFENGKDPWGIFKDDFKDSLQEKEPADGENEKAE